MIVCLFVAAVGALSCAAAQNENAAPADELARQKVSVDIPVAPEGYRRPRDWKPVLFAKPLRQIAKDHSQETMARARKQMSAVDQANHLGKYHPYGKSLDAHPCPEWFVDAKLGIFIDWGPWSVASWCPYVKGARLYPDWYEYRCRTDKATISYHEKNWGKDFKSDHFLDLFRGEKFDAPAMMRVFRDCGAKYVVPFLKHHGGFCLWDCSYTFRDSVDQGAHRDFAKEMADACRANGLKFGLYTSQAGEWEYPILQDDGSIKMAINKPDDLRPYSEDMEGYASGKIAVKDFVRDYIVPQTTEFIDRYDPDILWYDYDWMTSAHENGSYDITAYFYNRAEGRKEVACNDRYGKPFPPEIEGRFKARPRNWLRTVRGDFFTDEWGDTAECIDPKTWHPWESCSGISKAYGNHWMEGFDKSMVMSEREFVCHFADIVARGGNLLLLVNLDPQGAMVEHQKERLLQIGRWLKKNGEAIYGTRIVAPFSTPAVDYTQAKDGRTVYAIVKEPSERVALACALPGDARVTVLGSESALETRKEDGRTVVSVPPELVSADMPYVLKCAIQKAEPAVDGFGVRRESYVSGRVSAKVSETAGIFQLFHFGSNDVRRCVFSGEENCSWARCLALQAVVGKERYRIPWGKVTHYPFGYRNVFEVGGVRGEESLVLDRDTVFRHVRVLENGTGLPVRIACVNVRMEERGCWLGSLNPAERSPAAEENGLRTDLVELEPSDDHLFYLSFGPKDADYSLSRVAAVFDRDRHHAEGDARIGTGNDAVDECLRFVPRLCDVLEVEDGGLRASSTYWIWARDALVHSDVLCWCGRAESVRRLLEYFRRTADDRHGIPHSVVPRTDLHPAVQLLYVTALAGYVNATGDDATRDALLPFARMLVERAKASVRAGERLTRGLGFFPDHPERVGQRPDTCSVINNAIYLQGLAAWEDLTGEGAGDVRALQAAFRAAFWDAEACLWSDAFDPDAGCRLGGHPLYGCLYLSSVARDLSPDAVRHADALRANFRRGRILSMFPFGTTSFAADGNQCGAYYPDVDRTYWNAMNAAGRVESLAEFLELVGAYWRVRTIPEGDTADVVNADPLMGADNLGYKYFAAGKGWLADSLELNLGLKVDSKGIRFHAIGDGRPFLAEGLCFRGTSLTVSRRGKGTDADYQLNGKRIEDGFIPWSMLGNAENRLEIVCR